MKFQSPGHNSSILKLQEKRTNCVCSRPASKSMLGGVTEVFRQHPQNRGQCQRQEDGGKFRDAYVGSHFGNDIIVIRDR